MNILEEYLHRLGLVDMPAVHHCDRSFFVARQRIVSGASSFMMLDVMWTARSKGPGYYAVSVITPHKPSVNWRSFLRHTDSFSRSTLTRTLTTQSIEYDDYEEHIEKWFKTISLPDSGWVGAQDGESCLLMLWEIYVYVFDNLFAEAPALVRADLWDSLSAEATPAARRSSIDSVVSYVNRMSKSAGDFWSADLMLFSRRYANWMGRLFKNIRDSEAFHAG